MSKLFWVAVGAAGGVWAYRKAQQLAADSREQGVIVGVQRAGSSTASNLGSALGAVGTVTTMAGRVVGGQR